jgi:hypothetical protein
MHPNIYGYASNHLYNAKNNFTGLNQNIAQALTEASGASDSQSTVIVSFLQ